MYQPSMMRHNCSYYGYNFATGDCILNNITTLNNILFCYFSTHFKLTVSHYYVLATCMFYDLFL